MASLSNVTEFPEKVPLDYPLRQDIFLKNNPLMRQEKVTFSGRNYIAYTPLGIDLDGTIAICKKLFDSVVSDIVQGANEKIAERAQQFINLEKARIEAFFQFEIEALHASIDESSQNLYNELVKKKSEESKAALDTGSEFYGKLSDCISQANFIAKKFFSQSQKFSYFPKDGELDAWALKCRRLARGFLYKCFNIKTSKKQIYFSDEDLKLFGIDRKDVKVDPTKLKCFSYAFLKIGELRAMKFIFKEQSSELQNNLLTHLSAWCYHSVAVPNVGDIAVQFKDGITQHISVYLRDGIMEEYSRNCPLSEFVPISSKKIIFFRKGPELS